MELSYPVTWRNFMSNIVLEQMNQILVNLVCTNNINKTYIDKYDQKSVILMATAFSIRLIANRIKDYSPVQLLFGRDIILLIKYTVDK